MKITLTYDMLAGLGACRKGLDRFKLRHGNGGEFDWTPEAQVELLKDADFGPFFGWLVNKQLLPVYHVRLADFDGRKLNDRCINSLLFDHCYFNDTAWHGVDAVRTYFSMCEFNGARMEGVKLCRANFSNCYFRGAVLRDCDLVGATFSGFGLNSADFDGCIIAPHQLRVFAELGWKLVDGRLQRKGAQNVLSDARGA